MFNQRQPRRFNYKTRLPDSKKNQFDDALKTKWDEMRSNTNRKKRVLTSLPVLIAFLICVFALMYFLNGYIK